MKTTVTLEFASPAEAAAFLAEQGGAASAPAPAPAAPPPGAPAPAAPPPGAPNPAPAPAAPPPGAPAPAPAPAPTPTPAPAPASGGTQADVAAAIQKYATTHGPRAAKAKLGELGYQKTGDVPEAYYATVIQAMAV